MTNTLHYRDYLADVPAYGEFSVDTSGDTAVISHTWVSARTERDMGSPMGALVEFLPEQARYVGLRLIAWTGPDWAFMLTASEIFAGIRGSLTLDVVDGYPLVSVLTGPAIELTAEQAHDLGIRLVIFAGIPE